MSSFNVNSNNSIKIVGNKVIYIDPYEIEDSLYDADYIFCTHSHYDHFSEKDIRKVLNDKTKIITVESAKNEAEKITKRENILIIKLMI